jgi:hypothetical protein
VNCASCVESRACGNVKGGTVVYARLRHVFRGVGAALALLTFASPLLASLHEAKVRHVTCPDDGELIDAPAQAPRHAEGSSNSAAFFAEREPEAPPVAGQGHEHCAVMLQAHLRARERSRPLAVRVLTALVVVSVPVETPRLRSIELYRLAPKASPPLV